MTNRHPSCEAFESAEYLDMKYQEMRDEQAVRHFEEKE